MEGVTITMADPWGQVVRECEAGNVSQKSVAMTYAFGLRDEPFGGPTSDAIRAANLAIVARWNPKALARIKDMAWGYVQGTRRFGT